jgi:hypothetical protein
VKKLRKIFNGSEIEIIDFDDVTSGEHVIEFRDSSWNPNESVIAVSIPHDGSWSDAIVSISPRRGDLLAAFVIWAIRVAEERVH